MESLRDLKKADKRKRILNAALVEFADKGYTYAAIASVASSAGVAYGLVSQRIGAKSDLFVEVLSYSLKVLFEVEEEHCDSKACLEDIVRKIKQWAKEGSPFFDFFHVYFTNKDIPDNTYDTFSIIASRTPVHRYVSEAVKSGELRHDSIIELLYHFLEMSFAMTRTYLSMGLAFPPDEEYIGFLYHRRKYKALRKTERSLCEAEDSGQVGECEAVGSEQAGECEAEGFGQTGESETADSGQAEAGGLDGAIKHNPKMFRILLSEYSSIYLVNLITGEYDEYKVSGSRDKGVCELINHHTGYEEAFKAFVEKSVHPEDKYRLLNVFRSMKSNLAHHKNLSAYFRLDYNGEFLYTQLYAVKLDDIDQPATEITIGFAERDKQYRLELKSQKTQQQNQEVITALVSQYDAVYFIDLADGRVVPYLTSPIADQLFGEVITDGRAKLADVCRLFIDCVVYSADRDKVRAVASVDAIKEKLADHKKLELVFRRRDEYGIRYSQMQIIKLNSEHDTPTAVAVAFKYRDDEVIGQFINERFIDGYASIYFVDMENDIIRSYRQSEKSEQEHFDVVNYHLAVRVFARTVAPEYREMWRSFGDPDSVRRFLGNEDSREFVYQTLSTSGSSGNTWRRGQIHVVERKEGIPVTFIISFIGIDNITAEKMRLDAMIAEQKQALEIQSSKLRLALDKAEAANVAKTTFLSNMSHDIRTPMNAIMGFTNLALEYIDDTEKVKDYLLKTSVSSHHLLSLINDILDLSRIESGKIVITDASMDMRVFADNCRSIIMGLLIDRDLEYVADVPVLNNPIVLGDELHLRQILLNLLSNAVKYTLDGGTITFMMRESEPEDGKVIYSLIVKDTGLGMKPEFIEHIFEPFSQESGGARTQYRGTGLGMAIIKNLVDKMGGTIDIESKYEVGSTFTVKIPLVIDKDKHTIRTRSVRRDVRGLKVLVVEDNELNREIAAEILKSAGTKTEFAENGQEALDMFIASEPYYYDIILMDIMMPIMDGIAATKAIRALEREDAPTVPIIAMTANAFDDDVHKVREAGMNGHVSKPVDPPTLIRTMATCDRGRKKTDS